MAGKIIQVDAVYVNDSRSGKYHVFQIADPDQAMVGSIYVEVNSKPVPKKVQVNLLKDKSKARNDGLILLRDRARPESKQHRKLDRALRNG